ncbi:tetraspanin-32 isoform X6 [Rhinopithecus roxellana]|uniref:tetraspanin-32 isoform X6 n=1 Tax=Rhinopithecus roxellana TaxID=61622 RepID=UPI00123789A5|nr:tetraspanin-32 isoform X6 [Rhinopithecus roxellana]
MGPWSRVRVAKCQMLVTCFFILLLGLSVATMVTLTYFGAHFAVIRRASLEKNPYQAVHQWAFSAGLSLVGLLTLGAMLSAAATVREAQGLMAGVEDAMLDTYDLVYEQAMKGTSHVQRQELAAIQDMFLCCGKRSPFSRLGSTEADLCQGQEAARKDCLQGIRSFLRIHQQVASSLTSIGLALTVPPRLPSLPLPTSCPSACPAPDSDGMVTRDRISGLGPHWLPTSGSWSTVTVFASYSWAAPSHCRVLMLSGEGRPQPGAVGQPRVSPSQVSALLLSSFLWFAIRSGCSLDRKGKYTLAPRACGRQPQEPSLFRRSQGGPTHCLRSEADAIGPRRYSGSLRWLQDNDAAPGPLSRHLPAHRGEDTPAVSPHGIPEGRVRAVRRGGSEGPAREPGSIGNRCKGKG